MQVKSILKAKGSRVVTVSPLTTIDALAHRLRLENIGAVIVSSDGASVDGIISERDVLRGLAEHGADLLAMSVVDLMTRGVQTCRPDADVKEVMRLMTQKRIRHLPVVDGGRLLGIVSIGDVVKNRLDDMEMEANVLRDYAIARG
ncbi:MAG: CBS domain-containing protein [Methyloligellaceae bacterium]